MLFDDDLLFGDPSEVAAFLGVSVRTLSRYKANPESMPEPVKRLLRLRLEGDLRAIGGKAWEGFYLGRDGKLYAPLWERGLSSNVVLSMFFVQQEAAALRCEVRDLRARVAALRLGVEYLRGGGDVAALQSFGEFAPLQVRHQSQSRRGT